MKIVFMAFAGITFSIGSFLLFKLIGENGLSLMVTAPTIVLLYILSALNCIGAILVEINQSQDKTAIKMIFQAYSDKAERTNLLLSNILIKLEEDVEEKEEG